MIDRTIWQRWMSLGENNSTELLLQLIELYLDSSLKSIHDIQEALNIKYAKGLSFHAHALKSSSASLGATLVSEMCLKIEKDAREEKLSEIPALLQQLLIEHKSVEAELRQEVLNLKNAG
jgi:HPt (histidine-containing phosphotransfer) domain-containing protein